MQTEDMIRHLAAQAPAVRRLPAPPSRLMRWLAWSVPWVVAVVLLMGVRPDLGAKVHDLRWLAEQGAALATALMAAMLRRSATVAPVTAAALGALASAGLAAFGLRLFHVEDASGMVLVWQVGTVMVLTLAGGMGGPRLLRWPITRL